MYKGNKILALIPARGGSKGIPRKNIVDLGGSPLISWTIDSARKSKFIDKLILSSEDQEIINIAQNNGCEVPFVRPKDLAGDTTKSIDVILHALDTIEGRYDYLLLLQPTSPFRTEFHIDNFVKKCIDSEAEVMVSVSKVKKHPSSLYYIDDNQISPIIESNTYSRRQDMPPTYEYNGALYISTIDYIQKYKSYKTSHVKPFEMDEYSSIDIDEESDLIYAECLLKTGKIKV